MKKELIGGANHETAKFMHLSMLSPRGGICGAFEFLSKFSIKCPTGWAINIGQMPHNKRHFVKLPYLRVQNANRNPWGEDAIGQIPHMFPTPPPLGLNIDRH
jgi:hypothetical protein